MNAVKKENIVLSLNKNRINSKNHTEKEGLGTCNIKCLRYDVSGSHLSNA